MKKIKVSLQQLRLRCPGTYYCNIYFKAENDYIESKLQGEGTTVAVNNGNFWKLGPIVKHAGSDVINDLENMEFIIDFIYESPSFPATIHLDLYQELPRSDPSTSQDKADETNLILFGKGELQLTLPKAWHSSVHENDNKVYSQRISINAIHDIGSIKFNLGWLSITNLFQESSTQNNIEKITDQLNINNDLLLLEDNTNDSPDTMAALPSKQMEVAAKSHEQKSTSFVFFQPSESLPPIDAVQQILPVYYKLVQQPPQRKDSVKPYLPVNEPEQTRSQSSDTKSMKCDDENNLELKLDKKELKSLDGHVISVLEYQTKELDRYRQAIRQMGELVLSLRNQIAELQLKNNQLRSDLFYVDSSNHASRHQDGLFSDSALQKSLVEQIEEQKAKLQKQQNELIVKNEYEKKYLKLLKAHQSQQTLLQDYQVKISKYQRLEKICKRQEKIIVELEANTARSIHGKKDNGNAPPMNVSFQDDRVRNGNIPGKLQSKFAFDQFNEIEERMTLIQKLEKAEGRIMALEKQMFDNARLWAREKSHLKVKSAEGFPEINDLTRGIPASHILPRYQLEHFDQNFYQFPSLKKHDVHGRFSQL